MIPGLTTKMVRGDCLHILFCNGVLGHLLGGVIHYLLWHDGGGVHQSTSLEVGALFQAVQKEYVRQNPPTKITNLRMSMLCDIKNPHKAFATLDLKAAETKHFLHAFIPVAKELLTMDLVEEKAMLQA